MEEIRKDVQDYMLLYSVSNLGNIKKYDHKNSKFVHMKQHTIWAWYLWVALHKKNNKIPRQVHRLVAQAFISNPENKPFINHKNWIRDDNRVENLEWCTSSENNLHAYRALWRKNCCLWRFWGKHYSSKRVLQYDINWKFIKERASGMDIQRELWFSGKCISSCCKNHSKTSYWYMWNHL